MNASLSNVTVNYGSFFSEKKKALQNCTLKIEGGKIYGLLGPNGAGKTTLFKSMLGFIQIESGSISIEDGGISAKTLSSTGSAGYVPENYKSDENFTVKELMYFFDGLKNPSNKGCENRILKAISEVELSNEINNYIKNLSKGLKRRVMLAQALLGSPKILLLDEPLEGLDPEFRHKLKQLILSLSKSGVCIIISTHELNEMQEIFDEVIILKKGILLFAGPLDSISEKKGHSLEENYLNLIKE
jgi:ABC-2 type transport system ATP-binding protein